ncbi:phosphotransacetylase family protein [Kallotenue papyrolyticum]|uniref:phosphotransacetylase family protein n=1 Tax=Kallotenue papyrolyticum TaxID=1325125 RepID=UPI0004785E2E|nr:phosphotransacetylase family protein [Kallotenue papyrolyticum]
MTTIYVASTETFVGKSALCVVLFEHARQAGRRVGYMKPVSVSVAQTEQGAVDLDAQFMRELFDLSEPLEQLAPVLATTRVLERVLHGDAPDFRQRLKATYETLAADKEVMILEGANTWAEGALLDLSADQVSDLLGAPVLLVNRFRSLAAIDAVAAVRRYLGQRLLGVVLNQVSASQLDYVREVVTPYLERTGVPVLGVIPHDPQIAAPTVQDVIEHLDAEVISDGDRTRLVEHLSVGAMSAESALRFFRRQANKAVITGGDRPDLQIAALETSTSCLILTGNMRPAATVIDRAVRNKVPILISPDDTLTTVQRLEALIGQQRFSALRREQFSRLADQHLDWRRLDRLLGL